MPSDVQDRYLHQSLSYTAWLNPANLTTHSFQKLLLASEILRPYIIHSLFHQAQDLHSTSANELLSLTEVPKPSVLLIRFLSKKKKKIAVFQKRLRICRLHHINPSAIRMFPNRYVNAICGGVADKKKISSQTIMNSLYT